MGSWSETLIWKKGEDLKLTVNVSALLFTFENLTSGKSVTFKIPPNTFDGIKEWRFCLFIWGSYS